MTASNPSLRITQPLRAEHQELLPHIEQLRAAADAAGVVSAGELHRLVADSYEFLSTHLIPHATAEDRALYPVVARLLGAPEATATMRRDHVAVGDLTAELRDILARLPGEAISNDDIRALRSVLYGLYALVRVHFAKEEEIYLPLLDTRLTPAEAARMFEAMEAAAAEAKAAVR